MGLKDRARDGFSQLPPALRSQVLHRTGRYAPWEEGFDFRPPDLGPDEVVGPPDFVGIGVQKAGTTWWYRLISTHPDVFRRPGIHKERHYFGRFGARPFAEEDIAGYHGWFPRPRHRTTGEWTPDYFTQPWVPPLLHRAAPDTRLLLLLRDPVARFHSGLAHQRRRGVRVDATTVNDAMQRGRYARSLDHWLRWFDDDRLLVLQYEQCVADPVVQFHRTLDFLGLSRIALPVSESSEGQRSGWADRDDELNRRLVDLYRPDVDELAERLPHFDMSLWPTASYRSGAPLSAAPSDGTDRANSPT